MNENIRDIKKRDLIISATLLHAPPDEAIREFDEKRDSIAAELNRVMLARPDLERLIGKENTSMMENNSNNFLRFMASLMHQYHPQTFVETSIWAMRAYRAHGFSVSYWPANLDTSVTVLKKHLSESGFTEVYPFFHWLIVHIPELVSITDEDQKRAGDSFT